MSVKTLALKVAMAHGNVGIFLCFINTDLNQWKLVTYLKLEVTHCLFDWFSLIKIRINISSPLIAKTIRSKVLVWVGVHGQAIYVRAAWLGVVQSLQFWIWIQGDKIFVAWTLGFPAHLRINIFYPSRTSVDEVSIRVGLALMPWLEYLSSCGVRLRCGWGWCSH